MSTAVAPRSSRILRHSLLVRITHWLTVVSFIALLVTGIEIVISHPRFYWGETGNVNMRPLFVIPIPASRESVPTGYGYVMPDANGWGRYLHFQSAWLLVFTGLVYVAASLLNGHFRHDLVPEGADRAPRAWLARIAQYLRRKPAGTEEAFSYNVLQRIAYLAVIFIVFPLIIWTGLALSPSMDSAFPWLVNIWGGRQTARTLHFFLTIALVAFFVIHLLMIALAGFWTRTRAMITGRITSDKEYRT